MISKKKVTALALAGLFVTPVLADTYVPDNSNSIQSGDGYLRKLFKTPISERWGSRFV